MSDIDVPDDVSTIVIKDRLNLTYGYYGDIEIIYMPRVVLIDSVDSSQYTRIFIDFDETGPGNLKLSDPGQTVVCLFGEEKIAADKCDFESTNITFDIHTPYGMKLNTSPIIITLTTIGQDYV